MSFLVTLIALLTERWLNWSHLRYWGWYDTYQNKLLKRFPIKSPRLALALCLVPILVLTIIIGLLLHGHSMGLLTLLFQVLVVLYCIGPQNLWADTAGASASESPQPAIEQIKTLFINANQRIFAVLFWYAILGPVGAVLYRISCLSARHLDPATETPSPVTGVAIEWQAILDWLPVRCLTFLFALAGHFVSVFQIWRRQLSAGPKENTAMLTECGLAALSNEVDGESQDQVIQKSALALLDRVGVIILVIAALGVLVI